MKKFLPKEGYKVQRGLSANPFNPFHENYFKLAKSVKNWQIAFLSIFILFIFSLFGIIRLSTQSFIVPYIVEVNKEEGVIRNIGEINKIRYVPNDKLIFSVLRSFIQNTRNIPLDQVVYGRNIQESYAFLNDVSIQKLLDYIEKDNVKEKIKDKKSRDISITSILKMDKNNFQIRWVENQYNKTGNKEKIKKYSGIFHIEIIKQTEEAKMLINPMGIIISDFSYSEEM